MKVLLFSGGVESTALAWQLRPDRLVFVDYGQIPALGEQKAARLIAAKFGLPLDEVEADVSALGAGDLIGSEPAQHSNATESWPFRNQILVTLAAMRYANEGVSEIMIGTVLTDAIHADGSPEFIDRIQRLVQCELPNLQITAPAIDKDTVSLVKESDVPLDLLGWTFSCHRATVACGQCRGCIKTLELFAALEI